MNKKYERYIDYIVNELEPPYFINMRDNYGLRPEEYRLVLSRVFNQPVTIESIEGNIVFNKDGNEIYFEDSYGFWRKREYTQRGNLIYFEDSDGIVIDYR